jgi:hypothetical protein
LIFGILIGVGYIIVIYLHDNPTQLAQNKAVIATTDTATKPQAIDTLSIPKADSIQLANHTLPSIDSTQRMATRYDTSHTTTVSTTSAQADKVETLQAEQTKALSPAKPEPGYADAATPMAAKEEAKAPVISTYEKSTEVSNKMLLAKTTFESNDFVNAGKKYDEILADQPNNADALYYSGVCSYINSNNAKAEQRFDKLLQRGLYNDGSKWYKANLLLKRGQQEQGLQLLYELSRTNGYFKDRALKKYLDMHH